MWCDSSIWKHIANTTTQNSTKTQRDEYINTNLNPNIDPLNLFKVTLNEKESLTKYIEKVSKKCQNHKSIHTNQCIHMIYDV